MSDPHLPDETIRKQAWDYFQMHSSQRLTTFNFYIVISSVITTALISTFQKDYKVPLLGIPIGLLLSFFSFIFWKLDSRNKELIKGAEAALRYFESISEFKDSDNIPHIAKVFQHEEWATYQRKEKRSFLPWKSHYSYSKLLNKVFLAFAIIGLIGATISAMRVL